MPPVLYRFQHVYYDRVRNIMKSLLCNIPFRTVSHSRNMKIEKCALKMFKYIFIVFLEFLRNMTTCRNLHTASLYVQFVLAGRHWGSDPRRLGSARLAGRGTAHTRRDAARLGSAPLRRRYTFHERAKTTRKPTSTNYELNFL